MSDKAKPKLINAQDLFPALLEEINRESDGGLDISKHADRVDSRKKYFVWESQKMKGKVQPPPPPDIGWLKDGNWDTSEKNSLNEIPSALVLGKQDDLDEAIFIPLRDLGYRVDVVGSSSDAINRFNFLPYSMVLLYSTNNRGEVGAFQDFHNMMSQLPMVTRRLIYYVVIGNGMRTLYNLEALSLSANLVVNIQHTRHLAVILKKGLRDYEGLFGPYIALLEKPTVRD